MVARLLCAVCQIVWIDANAVPTNKAWIELQEIPFGRGGGKHLPRVDAEPAEQPRELVHEGNVKIALRVLDNFGCLGDLDRGRAIDAGLDDRTIHISDNPQCLFILASNDLSTSFESMLLVTRIDAFWRIANSKIFAATQT